MKLYNLIRNEIIKMLAKKRLHVTIGILFVMVASFAYGQFHTLDSTKQRLEKRIGMSVDQDWRKLAEQQLIDFKSRIDNPYIGEERRATLKARMEQLRYYLNNNINPIDITGAVFTTKFIEQSVFLFLPLMMILLAADLVSGEFGTGTIKLLLVRGVSRIKILSSKYVALIMLVAVVIFFTFLISFTISGMFFGFTGWMLPVATGFQVAAGKLVTSNVVNVPQWQYTLMAYGLTFYVSAVVATISFMISVLVRSTAASIGIILSTLIGGSLLSVFSSDWILPRYLFMSNLRLTEYISGSLRPVEGMDMKFSVIVLAVWAMLSLAVSFIYFRKRDILV